MPGERLAVDCSQSSKICIRNAERSNSPADHHHYDYVVHVVTLSSMDENYRIGWICLLCNPDNLHIFTPITANLQESFVARISKGCFE